ncbi:MAG: hypothetical protein MHPSP_003668 [Paramarteilia canceri]
MFKSYVQSFFILISISHFSNIEPHYDIKTYIKAQANISMSRKITNLLLISEQNVTLKELINLIAGLLINSVQLVIQHEEWKKTIQSQNYLLFEKINQEIKESKLNIFNSFISKLSICNNFSTQIVKLLPWSIQICVDIFEKQYSVPCILTINDIWFSLLSYPNLPAHSSEFLLQTQCILCYTIDFNKSDHNYDSIFIISKHADIIRLHSFSLNSNKLEIINQLNLLKIEKRETLLLSKNERTDFLIDEKDDLHNETKPENPVVSNGDYSWTLNEECIHFSNILESNKLKPKFRHIFTSGKCL